MRRGIGLALRIGQGGLASLLALGACGGESAPPSAPATPAEKAAPSAPATPAEPAPAPAAKPTPLPPDTPAEPVGEMKKGDDGTQRLKIGGVEVVLLGDVPDRPQQDGPFSLSTNNGIALGLRGWPILLRDEHVYVAGQDFGATPQGSVIEIRKDGVFVAGERRGDLPR